MPSNWLTVFLANRAGFDLLDAQTVLCGQGFDVAEVVCIATRWQQRETHRFLSLGRVGMLSGFNGKQNATLWLQHPSKFLERERQIANIDENIGGHSQINAVIGLGLQGRCRSEHNSA